MIGAIRLFCRILVTPIIVVSFGFFWIGFMFFLGSMFAFFSFVENGNFDWKDHLKDCNEFFCEPLEQIWRKR
jgi:hypothetical protein